MEVIARSQAGAAAKATRSMRSRGSACATHRPRTASIADVSDPEPVLYQGSYLADDGYASRSANAFMAFQLRRPSVWIQIGLTLIFTPLLITALDKYPYSFPIALGADVVIVIAVVISWMTRRHNLTNRFSKQSLAGATRELSMTESTISIRSGDSFAQNPYRYFERADTYGDFVLIRLRGSSMRLIVPCQVFTDDSLAFLRSKFV